MSSKDKKKEKYFIPFSVDDYVQVATDNRKCLVQVTKRSDDMCAGVNQKHFPYSEDEIVFERDDVVANLGRRPERLGHEVHHSTSKLSGIGEINFFIKVSSSTKDDLKEVIKKGYKALEKKRLVSFFPLNFEVRPEKGRMLGYYSTDMKSDIDTMGFRIGELQDLTHCFYHEAAHGIWDRLITKRSTKAKWISLYNEFIAVDKLTKQQMNDLYHSFASMACTVTEFKDSLEDEEEVLLMKEVLSYIKKYHRIALKDLDLLADDDKKAIKALWPSDAISLTKEKDTGISLYSLKSPLELFCESFAFYMTGKSLPKSVKKLMSKTLEQAAT